MNKAVTWQITALLQEEYLENLHCSLSLHNIVNLTFVSESSLIINNKYLMNSDCLLDEKY